MGIASSMRDLAQNIASSHEDRTKTVLRIGEEAERVTGDAQDLIKGFQTSRSRSGAQLRKDLAKDKASRESDVKDMLGGARGLIKGFQASRRKEGAQLRTELARGLVERRSNVNTILGDSRQSIDAFRSRRKEASSELRGQLAQSHASCKSEVGELLKSAQDLVADLGNYRQETGEKLRKDLAKGRANRESGVKEMQSEFRKSQAGVRSDINEAGTAWQELTRGAKKAAVKGQVAEAVLSDEGIPDLKAKLLAAIRKHPQGITLTEVAESLGVVPITLGRASKRLLYEGKIRKEDKTYFPIARE